ncbi:AbrB/MazE/SpoVT family DNA-binding domain-containing protein [Brevibacillus borstelensis]|uniref:AbrB/MazE/SpoVT family DNA-binding domain-containing protein n=1 Tax=Brevibacillus borstelensis TaxID=45462 RepID=UPI0025595E80|nr:AbrB/MazE/SpoVT family DNA-binding domain-containing protein [Brevibacillus borstelensis]
MKSIGIVRQVDELGRVVIPKELRDVLDVQIKDPLEIFIDTENETIILKKYQGNTCIFCGQYSDDMMYFKKYLVCHTCIGELGASSEEGDRVHNLKQNEVAATNSDFEIDTKKEKWHKGTKSTDVMNQLYAAIMANPKASQAELARELGISQGYVCILMKKLRESGLIANKKQI